MPSEEFRHCVDELYQGEVIGTVLFEAMLAFYDDPSQVHKIASLLQLETETKARLRPFVVRLGIDPAEREESRAAGHEFADSMKGMEWDAAMRLLRDGIKPFVDRYCDIVAIAPREYRALAASMLCHEQALYRFTELKIEGETARSLDDVNAQLHWPLPVPD